MPHPEAFAILCRMKLSTARCLFFSLALPAGVAFCTPGISFDDRIAEAGTAGWSLYGGAWSVQDGVLALRGEDGPKALVEGLAASDFTLEADVRLADARSQAGLVFRVRNPAAGPDAMEGYYAGIAHNQAVLGALRGGWREIASRPTPVSAHTWYRVRVIARGGNIRFYVDNTLLGERGFPKADAADTAFAEGALGLRALGGEAHFRRVTVRPCPPPHAGKTYTNPVQAGGADPVVFRHGGIFHAYCTYTPDHPDMARGIRLYTSPDLVSWSDRGFALKDEDTWGRSCFWAPDIVEKAGRFLLYYAADTRLCVAEAGSPLGPFKQTVRKPMAPEWMRIDGHLFRDEDGQTFFYFVKFNHGNEIWGGKMNADLTSVDERTLRLMVKPDQPWETHQAPITEGPELIKHKGVYYLTYSGSHFENPNYAVGYATAPTPLGPWEKYAFNPIMKSTSYAHGTAHHCLVPSPDGRELFIVYHRHASLSATEPRALSIDRIQFVPQPDGPDALEVWGPTSSPQPAPSARAAVPEARPAQPPPAKPPE